MAATGKAHRKKKTGVKAEKRKKAEQKKKGVAEDGKHQNPRAFMVSSGKAKSAAARNAEREQRRLQVPIMEAAVSEPPPFVVLVQGPPGVGKSTLIRCLVKHYCRQSLSEVKGPVTVVAGKTRRITFVECPHDLNGMLDAAKIADLVLLLVDGSFGFEMETFEFLNLLQVHGFPKVMGVLTHLDGFQDQSQLKKTKKKLKARFWAEIYDGAKLFYLSGIQHGKYLKREVLNLARFISVMKGRPLTWRVAHPYVLADRLEDLTPGELVRSEPQCDRDVVLYGWLRGTNMRLGQRVHWAGVGDFSVQELDALPDPCPLPDKLKKRGLNDKERSIYAPMSDLGGLLYDKDAVYIDIPNWKVQYSAAAGGEGGGGGVTEGEQMVRDLHNPPQAVDEALAAGSIRLFQSGAPLAAGRGSDSEDSDDSGSEGEGEGGSDWSDSDSEGAAGAGGQARRGPVSLPREKSVVMEDGRVRRAALFQNDSVAAEDVSSDEEGEEDEDEQGGSDTEDEGAGNGYLEPHPDDDSGSEDSEGLGGAAKWKRQLGVHSVGRPTDLGALVYGVSACVVPGQQEPDDPMEMDSGDAGGGSDSDSEGDFFVRRSDRAGGTGGGRHRGSAVDGLDSSRALSEGVSAQSVLEDAPDLRAALKSRFVTGDWEAGAARAGARPQEEGSDDSEGDGDDEDGDGEVYGDFEDMETGEKFTGDGGDAVTEAAQQAIAAARAEELRAAKAAKKAAFDSKYDSRGPKGADLSEDEDEGGGGGGGAGGNKTAEGGKHGKGQPKEQTYYDAIKAEMAARSARSKAALDALPSATRTAMEGFRPGSYVRIRLTGVPCELVAHLDPTRPMLVGGLGQSEDKQGVMKMRFKRHRWFPKLLKTRDPLVFSCGWRRWQALPVYCLEDHNRRLRLLKYTPEHMHCMTVVYGPLAPQNTGVVAIQSLAGNARGWRVSGTGVVLEIDAELRVVKKLKLVGTPLHIKRHTAFIQGMFNSQVEASRFEGASIRTVSGIRGTIKKAVRPGGELKLPEGAVRATFEDKLLMSDMVFLRSWVAVDIPKFVNPVTNLLEPQAQVARKPKPVKHKKTSEPVTDTAAAQEAAPSALTTSNQQHSVAAAKPATAAVNGGGILSTRVLVPAEGEPSFTPALRFAGARPGQVFKLGPQGLGYYTDLGPQAAAAAARARAPLDSSHPAAAPTSTASGGRDQGGSGWVGMRTVAALRRDQGMGAPRHTDSLYRAIERAPRKFNPLHIPKALQAALPFKTKPKLEVASKTGRKTLEQKRAVMLEPQEKRAVTLLQQLNAIRNQKAVKRREQQARKSAERVKKQAAETAWRDNLNKERRKERYREEGKAQKRKEMMSDRAGGMAAKKRRKAGRDE